MTLTEHLALEISKIFKKDVQYHWNVNRNRLLPWLANIKNSELLWVWQSGVLVNELYVFFVCTNYNLNPFIHNCIFSLHKTIILLKHIDIGLFLSFIHVTHVQTWVDEEFSCWNILSSVLFLDIFVFFVEVAVILY